MDKVTTFARYAITAALLFGVYTEAGIWTTLTLTIIFLNLIYGD